MLQVATGLKKQRKVATWREANSTTVPVRVSEPGEVTLSTHSTIAAQHSVSTPHHQHNAPLPAHTQHATAVSLSTSSRHGQLTCSVWIHKPKCSSCVHSTLLCTMSCVARHECDQCDAQIPSLAAKGDKIRSFYELLGVLVTTSPTLVCLLILINAYIYQARPHSLVY